MGKRKKEKKRQRQQEEMLMQLEEQRLKKRRPAAPATQGSGSDSDEDTDAVLPADDQLISDADLHVAERVVAALASDPDEFAKPRYRNLRFVPMIPPTSQEFSGPANRRDRRGGAEKECSKGGGRT